MLRCVAMFGLALAACSAGPPPTPSEKRELALVTSLPIVFGEGFTLDLPKSPLLAALEERYSVRPVDGPEQLRADGLLLAIQPQALTAERLVALDKWVRGGGRLVLLADPRLTFESERPLGDRFRPPYSFPDTGLLRHWGLALGEGEGGAGETDLGRGIRIVADQPGALTRAGGDCTLSPSRVAARCRIGKGYATIVADADFALADAAGNGQAVVALVRELGRSSRN